MQKSVECEPEILLDLGFGSQIYLIEYWVNDTYGKGVMCPNNADFFWLWVKRKHNIKTIRQFRFNIIKQVGTSNVY